MTVPVRLLLSELGEAWQPEVIIPTKGMTGHRLPHWYSVDLALPVKLLAVEADGQSHLTARRQAEDRKKDSALLSAGWTVLRFTNHAILADTAACVMQIQTTAAQL